MFKQVTAMFALVSAALLMQLSVTHAAEPTMTTIDVQGMHCAACASKITRNLEAVSGVRTAKVDADKALAVISSAADQAPSPRALWEAVEKAGYKPTRLAGPSGTFTAKPKS